MAAAYADTTSLVLRISTRQPRYATIFAAHKNLIASKDPLFQRRFKYAIIAFNETTLEALMNYLELLSGIDQWVSHTPDILAAGIINDSTEDAQRADFSLLLLVADVSQGTESVNDFLNQQSINVSAQNTSAATIQTTVVHAEADELKLKFHVCAFGAVHALVASELAALVLNGCSIIKDQQKTLEQVIQNLDVRREK